MAKAALPIEATRAAVKQLTDSGVRFATITVRDVREITGTGSFSTISDQLDTLRGEWIEAVPEGQVDLIELDPLTDAVQTIVNRKLAKAETRHEDERVADREKISSLSDDLELATEENRALAAQLEEAQAQNLALHESIATAREREATLRGELDATRALYDGLLPRIGPPPADAQDDQNQREADAAHALAAGQLKLPVPSGREEGVEG